MRSGLGWGPGEAGNVLTRFLSASLRAGITPR